MDENGSQTGARSVVGSVMLRPLRSNVQFLRQRAEFMTACLRSNAATVRALIRNVAPRLSRVTRKHCVYASVRNGSISTLRALIKGGFAVPPASLLYMPPYLTSRTAEEIGIELLIHGASARSTSPTVGTVIMVVLPHCYSARGVTLLRLVLIAGAARARLPRGSPARLLETAVPIEYVMQRVRRTGNRNWALAAIDLVGPTRAIELALRSDSADVRHAVNMLILAGCDPRQSATMTGLLSHRSLSAIKNICGTNPFAPMTVQIATRSLLACNSVRRHRALVALPTELVFLIAACIQWTHNH